MRLAVAAALVASTSLAHADDDHRELDVVGGAVVGKTWLGREGGVQGEALYQVWRRIPVFVRASGFAGPIHDETWGAAFGAFVGAEGRACLNAKTVCFVGGLDLGYERDLRVQPHLDRGGGTVGFHTGIDVGPGDVRVRALFDYGQHHDALLDPQIGPVSHLFVGLGYRF